MNILNIIENLRAEKAAGDEMAAQLVERIDAHIHDLETLKLWVLDRAKARAIELGALVGEEPKSTEQPQVEAA